MGAWELWGLDHTLESESAFFTSLPVVREGDAFARAMSFHWSSGGGLIQGLTQEAVEDTTEVLDLRAPVTVPEGHVVLVMGPRFAKSLNALGIALKPDWIRVQRDFCIFVTSAEDADQRRSSFAQQAHAILVEVLSRMLQERREGLLGRTSSQATLLSRRMAAHTIILNASFHDPFEIALLDLIHADLLGDGGITYSRLEGLYTRSLRVSVERLRMSVESRMSHLLRCVPAVRPTQSSVRREAWGPAPVEPVPESRVRPDRANVPEYVPNPFPR